jgi:hypothetical protein
VRRYFGLRFSLSLMMLVAGLAAVSAPVAWADSALDRCLRGAAASFAAAPFTAAGNASTSWTSPFQLLSGDVLRVTASGSTRIDFWGTNKPSSGDPALAPFPVPGSTESWPMSGAHKYALVGKTIGGTFSGGFYTNGSAVEVGYDSGCFVYHASGYTSSGEIYFLNNDTRLDDNGGGPTVVVRQYF